MTTSATTIRPLHLSRMTAAECEAVEQALLYDWERPVWYRFNSDLAFDADRRLSDRSCLLAIVRKRHREAAGGDNGDEA